MGRSYVGLVLGATSEVLIGSRHTKLFGVRVVTPSGEDSANLQSAWVTPILVLAVGVRSPVSHRGHELELRPAEITDTELANDNEELLEFNRKSHHTSRAPRPFTSYMHTN